MGTKERKREEIGRGNKRGQSWRFPIKVYVWSVACWGGDLNSYLL